MSSILASLSEEAALEVRTLAGSLSGVCGIPPLARANAGMSATLWPDFLLIAQRTIDGLMILRIRSPEYLVSYSFTQRTQCMLIALATGLDPDMTKQELD